MPPRRINCLAPLDFSSLAVLRPLPHLNHPSTRRVSPPLLTSRVSQLAAISHSSTNWITLSCERPMVTAANTRAARWRSEDESSLRGGIFWDAIRFRWPCFREENSLPNFLGEKFWNDIFRWFLLRISQRNNIIRSSYFKIQGGLRETYSFHRGNFIV